MDPLYFGPLKRQLFGIFHPADGTDVGVLLCYPAPQEYMRTHWAMRRLATLCAQRGVPVLRFDYFGTGDSAGEMHQASLDIWRDNIRAAAAELREISGVRRVSIVGLRLGATLAAQVAGDGIEIEDLVLWEPVVHGAAYLEELDHVATRKFSRLLHHDRARNNELLGYDLPRALAESTRAIDLTNVKPRARRIGVFAGDQLPLHARLVESLTAAGSRIVYECVRESEGAAGMSAEAALLSAAVLQAIARHVSCPEP